MSRLRHAAPVAVDFSSAIVAAGRSPSPGARELPRLALEDDAPAVLPRLGPQLHDPVGARDDVRVVLDDDQRVTPVHEALEDAQQALDVGQVQPRRRLVEHVDRGLVRGARRQLRGELQALRLSSDVDSAEALPGLHVAEPPRSTSPMASGTCRSCDGQRAACAASAAGRPARRSPICSDLAPASTLQARRRLEPANRLTPSHGAGDVWKKKGASATIRCHTPRSHASAPAAPARRELNERARDRSRSVLARRAANEELAHLVPDSEERRGHRSAAFRPMGDWSDAPCARRTALVPLMPSYSPGSGLTSFNARRSAG